MQTNNSRRRFLKHSLAGAVSLSPLMTMLSHLEKLEAADIGSGYKALICVLLEGGADVCNMIAPIKNSAYAKYREVRKNIALPQESLLKINNEYGFRENMTAMQRLFIQKKLAVVANVGTLIRPITPKEIRENLRSTPVPFELFAHNTQRNQWMFGDATGSSKNGWAARMSDRLYSAGDRADSYSKVNVADVNTLMLSGGREEAIGFSEASISPDTMKYFGFGEESGGGDLGKVYQALYEAKQNSTHKLMAEFAKKRVAELNRPYELEGLFDGVREFDHFSTGVHEVGKPLGAQLELVAKILSVKDRFPGSPKRQIFFVNHHGWDTHDSDNEHQVGYLSESLGAFQAAVDEMGIGENVTTFTISDFGRSLTPNGAGTDHGWGSHAFVMGGAVKGGKIYGRMPRIEVNSPDAWYDRLVPTISMESYLATLVKWFGANDHELDEIFPNLKSFPVRDLGYMG